MRRSGGQWSVDQRNSLFEGLRRFLRVDIEPLQRRMGQNELSEIIKPHAAFLEFEVC